MMWLVIGMAAAKETPELVRKVDGISYHADEQKVDDPEKRCFIDMRLPENVKDFPTLVWFHGGGLTGGTRDFPAFEGKGVALVSAGYRLAPPADCPDFLTDAAAAVAWTLKHISEYGGDPKKVFIGGHSAGGYTVLERFEWPQALLKQWRAKATDGSYQPAPNDLRIVVTGKKHAVCIVAEEMALEDRKGKITVSVLTGGVFLK